MLGGYLYGVYFENLLLLGFNYFLIVAVVVVYVLDLGKYLRMEAA